jgi:hypothetical protein
MMAENFLHPSIVPQSMSAATPTPRCRCFASRHIPDIELLEGAPRGTGGQTLPA